MTSEYVFLNRTYSEADELVRAMAQNWNEGKKALFSGSVRGWAQQSAREIYYLALAAQNSRKKDPLNEDLIYFRWLYRSCAMKELYWKGVSYGDPQQLSALLRAGTVPALGGVLCGLVRAGLFSLFLDSAGAEEDICRQARTVEKVTGGKNSRMPDQYIIRLAAGVLEPAQDFVFDGAQCASVEDLAVRLQGYADKKAEVFEKKTAQLYGNDGEMKPEFFVWLLKQGQDKAVLAWHRRYMTGAEEDLSETDGEAGVESKERFAQEPAVGFIPTLKKPSKEFFLGTADDDTGNSFSEGEKNGAVAASGDGQD